MAKLGDLQIPILNAFLEGPVAVEFHSKDFENPSNSDVKTVTVVNEEGGIATNVVTGLVDQGGLLTTESIVVSYPAPATEDPTGA